MIDTDNWEGLPVESVAEIFHEIDVQWWIAGGWALDLFIGDTGRLHKDTDIQILRKDQLAVQEHFSGWQLFKTNQPGLASWPKGEFLNSPINSVWARRDDKSPWVLDIKLMETEQDCWVYRRLPSIRGKISELGSTTDGGIPYIAPEIQLLYKSGANTDKDRFDLERTLSQLHPAKIKWLLDCLHMQNPSGHEWVGIIEHWSDNK